MERLEITILRNLIFNEDYARKVIPFIQPEYFEKRTEKIFFEETVKFIVKYLSSNFLCLYEDQNKRAYINLKYCFFPIVGIRVISK